MNPNLRILDEAVFYDIDRFKGQLERIHSHGCEYGLRDRVVSNINRARENIELKHH